MQSNDDTSNSDPLTDDDDWDSYEKSKSRLKQEMTALQELGIAIAELPDAKRNKFQLTDTLRFALEEYRRIRHKNARKRQAQYIGKLMRTEGAESLQAQWQALEEEEHRKTRQFHLVEQWRDRLVKEGSSALNDFLQQYTHTDRQQLRQLLNAIHTLNTQQKSSTAKTRKLFTFLQNTMSVSDDTA